MKRIRLVLAALPLALLMACGETPDQTHKARGLLTGVNLIAGLTVIVLVAAIGFMLLAVASDRFVRTRRALATAPPAAPEEEEDEVVAGITVGRAGVPRWLYACYVLIPVFAISYVFSNVSVAPKRATPKPSGTPVGPETKVDIEMASIKFSLKEMTVAAGQKITVNATNKDAGVPHTFTVWKSEADATAQNASGKIADTGQFQGKKTLTFKTGPPGKWYFDCTVHPSMKGTITVS